MRGFFIYSGKLPSIFQRPELILLTQDSAVFSGGHTEIPYVSFLWEKGRLLSWS